MPLWSLLFIALLHVAFLSCVVQSIRLGRIVRINHSGLSRVEHPVRFWYHTIMTALGATIIAGVFYYVAHRDGVSW